MGGRLYAVDGALLDARPEIRLGDRVYAVDNRMSVFLQITKDLEARAADESELDIILRHALGAEAYAEIVAQDLPFAVMRRLVVLAMAAVQDIEEDEAERRFQREATA